MPGRVAPASGATRWLFGDQLGPHFLEDHDGPVLLVESRRVFARKVFHRQKAHLVLSAMRHRAAELGERCRYARVDRHRDALGVVDERLQVLQPTSRVAVAFVRAVAAEREIERLPARGYVTSREDFTA
jgi:deoxyribodipyrimidine photolyase-related protein